MKSTLVYSFVMAFALVGLLPAATLTMEQTIPLPGVEGRIDHFSLDAVGHRLFVAALGNNTVEVVNLDDGKVMHSIAGLAEPQGVYYLGELNRLYVANGGDGVVRVYDGKTFAAVTTIATDDDADNLRYDAAAKRLYVGHGKGALSAIDVVSNTVVGTVPLKGHPESFQLEKPGAGIFVNVPGAHHIAVIDRDKKSVVSTWSMGLAAANFPMALDEPNHRLMVACRVPARLIVFDTASGKEITKLDLHGDCDDLFFDAARHQIYASCGEGFIDVFTQTDADHYALKEAIKTENKARTCFFDGDRFYLAVPKRGERPAEVRCYRVEK
jgi:DNA-binding beta-propeller fold protein YncE